MTIQATFCATLVDEWVRAGVRRAVIAPGSRSAPLTIAILADGRLETFFRLDERSGAFFALGIALEGGEPVVVVTTSGTAASEVHAAVIEADLARVPLIVVTTDRPFELHGVGAPQTIVQSGLFGAAVRHAADPGVPDGAAIGSWRSFASRLVVEATASPTGPGPVHLNLALRDPLAGAPDPLPPGRPQNRPWHEVVADRAPGPSSTARFLDAVAGRTGVLIAGGPLGADPEPVLELARRLGWPVFAEPRAIPRRDDPVLIAHPDGLVRADAVTATLLPEVVVHLGAPHASKSVSVWCAATARDGALHVLVDPYGAFADPERLADLVFRCDPVALAAAATVSVVEPAAAEWLASWRAADDAAAVAIARVTEEADGVTEPGVASLVLATVRPGTRVFASSSMPVRDLEWFAPARPDAPIVYANRGANGIDGVTSTALGVAAAAGPEHDVVAIVGDLAFLHDLSGLVFGAHEIVPDATFVVVDNRGGGIFSFLAYPEVLDAATFERAFGTPQRPDIAATVRGLGHRAVEAQSLEDLVAALDEPTRGITVVIVRTDRTENVAFHDFIEQAVVTAVEAALDGP